MKTTLWFNLQTAANDARRSCPKQIVSTVCYKINLSWYPVSSKLASYTCEHRRLIAYSVYQKNCVYWSIFVEVIWKYHRGSVFWTTVYIQTNLSWTCLESAASSRQKSSCDGRQCRCFRPTHKCFVEQESSPQVRSMFGSNKLV